MCRSKSAGGVRCSSQEKARVERLDEQLRQAKIIGNPERIAVLESRLEAAHKDYNQTFCGRRELAEQAEDESLSIKDRAEARRKLKQAEEGIEKQRAAHLKAFKQQTALRAVLSEAGVSKEDADALIALGTSGEQQRWLRPARYYKDLIKRINTDRKTFSQKLDEEEAEIWTTSAREGWSQEKTSAALDAFEVSKADRMAPLNSKLQEARFSYHCTAEGQERLKEQIAALPAHDYRKRARLRWTLRSAERFHRARLTHRDQRSLFNRKLKALMLEAGANPQKALDAYRTPEVEVKERKEPHEATDSHRVHLTAKEKEAVLRSFRASNHYEEQGEKGLAPFLRARVRQDPRAVHTGSVDEANARAEIFSTPAPGRNPTSRSGNREASIFVTLSGKEKAQLGETAKTLEMSFSSYARSLFLGSWETSPFAQQNDRSPQHREMKSQKMKKLLNET